jgi:hypothetical protein
MNVIRIALLSVTLIGSHFFTAPLAMAADKVQQTSTSKQRYKARKKAEKKAAEQAHSAREEAKAQQVQVQAQAAREETKAEQVQAAHKESFLRLQRLYIPIFSGETERVINFIKDDISKYDKKNGTSVAVWWKEYQETFEGLHSHMMNYLNLNSIYIPKLKAHENRNISLTGYDLFLFYEIIKWTEEGRGFVGGSHFYSLVAIDAKENSRNAMLWWVDLHTRLGNGTLDTSLAEHGL